MARFEEDGPAESRLLSLHQGVLGQYISEVD